MKNIYIFDGREIRERDIHYTYLKRGFLYGDGVFETLRAENYRIFMWDEHIKRLEDAAAVCGINLEEIKERKKKIEKCLKRYRIEDAYIRINLWRKRPEVFDPEKEREVHSLVITRKYHPYPERCYKEGIRCIVSKKYFRNEKSPVVYIKSLNYLENILARIEAKNNYCDDTIMLNTSGYISSATVSNIFFVKKEKVYTPSVDCGLRPGTIREVILRVCNENGIKVKEGKFTIKDLGKAEEVFLTNTLAGVLPVKEIRGIFKSKGFRISEFLREEMRRRIKG